MERDINYYVKFLCEKNRQCNEYCAKVRRDEFYLAMNNGRSDIDWKNY